MGGGSSHPKWTVTDPDSVVDPDHRGLDPSHQEVHTSGRVVVTDPWTIFIFRRPGWDLEDLVFKTPSLGR